MTDWLKSQVRELETLFPGVSSYSTIRKLIVTWGVEGARRQLELWQSRGTSAPRKG